MQSKIFIIGFNKTATRAFHNLFKNSEIKSIHWDNGKLAEKIVNNDKEDLPLLTGYEEFIAFSDMECVTKNNAIYPHMSHFKKLFHQYPNSYFILNTRPLIDWVNSRKKHGNGHYLHLCMSASGLNEEQITQQWIKEYYTHHSDVLNFFDGYKKFLFIDITQLKPTTLKEFLSDDYEINTNHWNHLALHKAK